MKKLACGAAFSLLLLLVLAACGEQATPVSSNATSDGSPLSPIRTAFATIQSSPTAAAGTATTAVSTTAPATTATFKTSNATTSVGTTGASNTTAAVKTFGPTPTDAPSAIPRTRPSNTVTPGASTPAAAVTPPTYNYLTQKYSTPVLYTGHNDLIKTAIFSPDGKMFATGSDDHTVKLWDTASGNLIQTFSDLGGEVQTLAFSPDSKQLAAGGYATAVNLWDTATGKTIRNFGGLNSSGDYNGLGFSKDGKLLGTARYGSFVVWNATTGETVQEIKQPSDMGQPQNIALSSDGKLVAVADKGGRIEILDTTQNNQVLGKMPNGPAPTFMRFSGDNKTFFGGNYSWDIAGDKAITKYPVTLIALSADESQVVGYDKSKDFVDFFNITDPTPQVTIDFVNLKAAPLDLNPDFSESIVPFTGGLGVYVKSTGKPTYFIGARKFDNPLAISPDGSLIADFTQNKDTARIRNIQIMEAASGKVLTSIIVPRNFNDTISQMNFSPDGTQLAAGGSIWDVKTGNQVAVLKTSAGGGSQMNVFSPNGALVATADFEGAIYLTDSTGKSTTKVNTKRPNNDLYHSLAFSPDSKKLAVSSSSGIQVIDLTATPPKVAVTYGGNITYSVAWSSDQNFMLINDTHSYAIYEGDLNDLQVYVDYQDANSLKSPVVAYSQNGKRVFAIGSGSVIGWDRDSRAQLFRTPLSETYDTTGFTVSPDGKTLYTAQSDGSVKAWQLP